MRCSTRGRCPTFWNIIRRLTTSFTGLPSCRAAAAASADWVQGHSLPPKPEPRNFVMTRTFFFATPSICASTLRWLTTPCEVSYKVDVDPSHNPIELHASVGLGEGSTVTLYDTSQGVVNHRNVLAQMLGVAKENVRVITKFLGSGFGGKLWPWTQSALAAAAARQLGRPVKLVVSRRMMFQSVGHRPRIQQRIRLSATRDGKLTSLRQDWVNHTSILDDYKENCGEATAHMYSVPNLRITSALARRNVGTPTPMRGPGAVPGLWATESAM